MRAREHEIEEERTTAPPAHASPEQGPAALLALQQSAGNQAVARFLRDSGGTGPAPDAGTTDTGTAPAADAGTTPDAGAVTGTPTEEQLDAIEQRYRDMIANARTIGAEEAARNLEWFLAGTGGTRPFTHEWLRGYGAVTDAERTNQQRFERQLTEAAEGMTDGQTRVIDDYWDRALTASPLTELYYASGTSQLRSTGHFELTQSGGTVTVTGTVHHRWFDPYNWNAGQAAFIPGSGLVSDNDGLLMERHRGAKPFMLEGTWDQTVSGTVTKREYWFDSHDWTWSGP
jgi:hypothetical protein